MADLTMQGDDVSQLLAQLAVQKNIGQAQTAQSAGYTPDDYAQLVVAQQQANRKREMAQQLMTQGYIPHSGKAGIVGAVLSGLAGAKMMKEGDASLTDALKRNFSMQQQASVSKRQQDLADEQRKWDEARKAHAADTEVDASTKAKYDPKTQALASLTPEQRQRAQLIEFGLAPKAEGARAPTEIDQKVAQLRKLGATDDQIRQHLLGGQGASPFGDITAAVKAGVITPEQAQGAIREKVGVGTKVQQVSPENRVKLAQLDTAQQALDRINRNAFNPDGTSKNRFVTTMGPGASAEEEMVNNILRVESGAVIGPSETKAGQGRYGISPLNGDDRNAYNLKQAQEKIAAERKRIMEGSNADPSAQASAPAIDANALMAEARRRGLIQ